MMSPTEKTPSKTKPVKAKSIAAAKARRPTKKQLKAATEKTLAQYGNAIKKLAKR